MVQSFEDPSDEKNDPSEVSPLIYEKLDRLREEIHSAMERSRAQLERIRSMVLALQFEERGRLKHQ